MRRIWNIKYRYRGGKGIITNHHIKMLGDRHYGQKGNKNLELFNDQEDVHRDTISFKTYLNDVRNGIEFSTVEIGNTIKGQNMEQEVRKIEIHVWTESSDEPQLIISTHEAKFLAHSGTVIYTKEFDRDN